MENDYNWTPKYQAGTLECIAAQFVEKWNGTYLFPIKPFFANDATVPDDTMLRISTTPVLLLNVELESNPGTTYGTLDELCLKLSSEEMAGALQNELIGTLMELNDPTQEKLS